MGRELEYKFRLTDAGYECLRREFGPLAETRMETAYYDTPSRELGAAGVTLRRRLENGESIVTLKTRLPDGSRGEWETEAPTVQAGLPALTAQGAPVPGVEGLTEICSARFTRLSRLLTYPGGAAELALDKGVLAGKTEEAPLLEAELELKQGSDEPFGDFVRGFAAKYCLTEEPKSKFARAKELR